MSFRPRKCWYEIHLGELIFFGFKMSSSERCVSSMDDYPMAHRREARYVWIETTEMAKANISVTLQIQPTGRMEPAGVVMCGQKM